MKRRGIMGILLLGLLLIGATACGDGDELTTNQPTVKSNITVTGDGNIEASSHERLTFSSGGRIEKIYVKEGDKVNKGDILAKLDTSALELAKAQAQVAFTGQQVAEIQAGVAVTQAEVMLRIVKHSLDEARDLYTWPEIKNAQADVDDAEAYLQYALDRGLSLETVEYAQARLAVAEAKLNAQINSYDTEEVAIKKMEVTLAEQNLELARQSLAHSHETVKQADQALAQAQKDLNEATIVAPFDGTISKVGAKEGEYLSLAVFTEKTIVELIDPGHMELTARVNELDVVKVKTGQNVMISVDAIPGMKLEGQVTFISPVAKEPVGVVLFEDDDEEKYYEVKIDFDILENSPIRAGMSATAEIIVE
jgi:multidrug resistance efflux pump